MDSTRTVRRVVELSRDEDVTFKAAGIAFYAITSLIPLFVIALAVLSAFGAAGVLVSAIRSSVSGSVADVVDTAIQETRGHGVAGGLGVLFTLWSALKIFRGLSTAFEELYPETVDQSLLDRIAKSLVVFVLVLLAVGVLAVAGAALGSLPVPIPYPLVVGNVVAVLVLVVGLLPLYYVLPPETMTLRRALPGAVLAAVGWVLLQVGFSYYVRNAAAFAAYGFLGAVVLFITVLYVAAILLLLGAVVNVVLER